MMKKMMFRRGMAGFPMGIAIGYVITIVSSFCYGDGYYSPCMPALVGMMGNEINAVIFQTILCGAIGAGFAASSVVWDMGHWSLVKQTGIYFAIISLIMMPAAYFACWMEHSVKGFFSYFGIFVFFYAVIWMAEFFVGKHNVKHMNERLYKMKDDME